MASEADIVSPVSASASHIGGPILKVNPGESRLEYGRILDSCATSYDGISSIILVAFTGYCRDGVTGTQCSECKPNHYGFSPEGCKDCDCDPTGSNSQQCDLVTGKCDCRAKVK